MSLIKEVEIDGRKYKFEFQKYAKQANGTVMVSCGDTQVLVTVCANADAKEDIDFMPLTIDYIEKFYAAGRIPGGFVKRETKPSELETLTARTIDRPLRPLFPEGYRCETHVVATVLSYDGVNHPSTLAMTGASTALMISDVPFNGPLAMMRVGRNADKQFVTEPNAEDCQALNLWVAAKPDAVVMVEAGADFLSEKEMVDAINFAHKKMEPLFKMQLEIQKEIGVPKRELVTKNVDTDLVGKVAAMAAGPLKTALEIKDKLERAVAVKQISKDLQEKLNVESDPKLKMAIRAAYEDLHYNQVRSMVIETNKRIDGRGLEDIRKITCEISNLKRCHGSALFTRGETQALAVVTLGSEDDGQRMDTITTPNEKKKFMLNYNFPPYSVGEARPMRHPGRREIGHGALAERALERVVPKDYEYTIRLVSEVLESNGSSSMATVCGGTMAMLDAGVPLTEPIAGIAMGLVHEKNQYRVLSDILGDEDHLGDMDFKVCGGKDGITALQMDIKIDGLPSEVLLTALEQAKRGRIHILEKMNATISTPQEMSVYAPRIYKVKVKSDKIKDVIGPGGKVIKGLVAEYGVKIDIADDGTVSVVSSDAIQGEKALKAIKAITTDPEVGEIYLGKVKKTVDFGAFVEIKPGVEGLCHISQLEEGRVEKVEDVVKEGDEIMVKLLEVDRYGRLKLSRKDAMGQKPTEF